MTRPPRNVVGQHVRENAVLIKVSLDLCIGSGNCARLAPGVFDQDPEEGYAIVLEPAPTQESHAAVRQAAAVCPATAIALVETDQQDT